MEQPSKSFIDVIDSQDKFVTASYELQASVKRIGSILAVRSTPYRCMRAAGRHNSVIVSTKQKIDFLGGKGMNMGMVMHTSIGMDTATGIARAMA